MRYLGGGFAGQLGSEMVLLDECRDWGMGLSCLWLDSFCLFVQSLFLASMLVFSEP